MRYSMIMLCLVAAISGPLLRQAEAAVDLARAFVDLGQTTGECEPTDGGVGDDSGVTNLTPGTDLPQPHLWAMIDALAAPVALPVDAETQLREDRPPRPPTGSLRRHAWLQCFLF